MISFITLSKLRTRSRIFGKAVESSNFIFRWALTDLKQYPFTTLSPLSENQVDLFRRFGIIWQTN